MLHRRMKRDAASCKISDTLLACGVINVVIKVGTCCRPPTPEARISDPVPKTNSHTINISVRGAVRREVSSINSDVMA